MANGGAIRAGRAFVEIYTDDTKLQKGLLSVRRQLNSLAGFAAKIAAGLFAVGGAIAAPFFMAIQAGSDLEEVMNKFNVVFGENAEAVKKWGDEYGNQVGRSKKQIADFMASNQDLLVPMGFEEDAATKMSKQITQLSVDLASFNNKQDKDTLRDLQAALTGSGEVMKKYGVIVSEAAVKQELLNIGMDPKSVTEAQKAQARLNIIMRGTTAAQGDAIRSAGSYANRKKALAASIQNTADKIGTVLLPIITPLIAKMTSGVEVVGKFVDENQALVIGIAGTGAALIAAGGAFLGLAAASWVMSAGLAAVGGMIAIVKTGLLLLLSPVGLITVGLAAAGGAFLYFSGTGASVLSFLGDQFDKFKGRSNETLEALKAALSAGDYKTAAQVLWLALKSEWIRGTNALMEKVDAWTEFFTASWEGGIDNAAKYFIDAWAGLQKAWVVVTQFFGDAWDTVINGITNAWRAAQTYIADTVLSIIAKIDPEFDLDSARKSLNEEANSRKESRNDGVNDRVTARGKKADTELKKIESDRLGGKAEVDAEYKREQEARDKKAKTKSQERADNLTAAEKALSDARQKAKDSIKDDKKSGLAETAEGIAGSPGAASLAKASSSSGGSGDLKTEAGVKQLATLFNNSGEGKTITELKKQIVLLTGIYSELKNTKKPKIAKL